MKEGMLLPIFPTHWRSTSLSCLPAILLLQYFIGYNSLVSQAQQLWGAMRLAEKESAAWAAQASIWNFTRAVLKLLPFDKGLMPYQILSNTEPLGPILAEYCLRYLKMQMPGHDVNFNLLERQRYKRSGRHRNAGPQDMSHHPGYQPMPAEAHQFHAQQQLHGGQMFHPVQVFYPRSLT